MNTRLTVRLGPQPASRVPRQPRRGGLAVTLADTGEATMTGGRLARDAQVPRRRRPFMLHLRRRRARRRLAQLLAFHRAHGKSRRSPRCGRRPLRRAVARRRRRCVEFNEKPQADEGLDQRRLLRLRRASALGLPRRRRPACVLEAEPLRAPGRATASWWPTEHDGFWQPMDTLREYKLLNDLWAIGRAPWKVWE